MDGDNAQAIRPLLNGPYLVTNMANLLNSGGERPKRGRATAAPGVTINVASTTMIGSRIGPRSPFSCDRQSSSP